MSLKTFFQNSEFIHHPSLKVALVYHDGKVIEHLSEKATLDSLYPLYSITKSIVSMGFAKLYDDFGKDILDEKIMPLLGISSSDERKNQWTFRHLLTQTSGLKWKELNVKWGPDSSLWNMEQSKNWIEFVVNTANSSDAGRHFNYSSGISHLLPTLISNKVGISSSEFFIDNVFKPMDIQSFSWDVDPQGQLAGGKGLSLKPYDLLKIGIHLLENTKWYEVCLDNKIRALQSIGDYGFHWWFRNRVQMGVGFGGKLLYVDRKNDLVVAVLGDFKKEAFFEPIRFAESLSMNF